MGIQTFSGYALFPTGHSINLLSFRSLLLDATGEQAAYIFRVPKTGNIRKVGFRTGTVTTGMTADVRLETVDATTGDPTGTLVAANTNASQVIADTDDNTWFLPTLTADAAVTIGQILAVVVVWATGGNLNINAAITGVPTHNFPYADHFTTSWGKREETPLGFIEYDDGTTANAYVIPVKTAATANTDINTGSNPDEVGNRFQFAFPMRAAGAFVAIDPAATGDFDIVLYEGTTSKASVSVDASQMLGDTTRKCFFQFATPYVMLANTEYFLVVKPTTATNVRVSTLQLPSAAMMAALDGGTAIYRANRVDAGAWTAVTDERISLAILVDGFDDGTGMVSVHNTVVGTRGPHVGY